MLDYLPPTLKVSKEEYLEHMKEKWDAYGIEPGKKKKKKKKGAKKKKWFQNIIKYNNNSK